MKTFGFDTDQAFTYENGFYLTSDPKRLQKLIAHFELYKRISHLPGTVIELGVFKGASLIRFASFRDMLETPESRKVIGFDAFGRFPRPESGSAADADFIDLFEEVAGDGISQESLNDFLAHKGLSNIELVAGDIMQTLPAYLTAHPQLKVSLLHIDVDVYGPSKLALDLLASRMVKGGIIVLDDYGTVEGETRAVDEFIQGTDLHVEKLPFSHIPAFITVK
ncbi:TylF/MycF/NovP-related O-methyltransferase [Pokkaliibacter sp. CJK22405]|uniref:TylF/MycF/NovP-related O-methyltransferase n=1 Tax=Pokkaliibacter sp. CJK22405 TaxID=3384615 RepID=UPI00398478D8